MDCDAFEANLVDLLYEELDAASTKTMLEHAAGCASCTKKRDKLERAQEVFRSGLALPSPAELEAKILAAASQAGAPKSAPHQPAPKTAKVFRLFARPELAVAATLILFVGGALFLQTSSRKAESSAAGTPAQASVIAAGAPAEPAEVAPPPPPVAAAPAPTTEAEPGSAYGAASAVALAERADRPRAQAAHAPPAPKPMARSRESELSALSEEKALSGKKDSAKGASVGPSFAQAKALFDAGKYAEALSQFDAVAPSNLEAALYAARCVAKLKGCAAAAPRLERIKNQSANPSVATQAAGDLSRCPAAPSATTNVTE